MSDFAVRPDLIFDIGLHKGLDAEFYLRKGFKVVGLEASPVLCEAVRVKYADDIKSGRLQVIERALFERSGDTVEFFINPDKDDWGSLFQNAAEKGVGNAVKINVKTITLEQIFVEHGVPYYLKCDIEGGDAIVARQLLQSTARPTFVSLEATSAEDINNLRATGYERFQIVNQYLNPTTECPNPAREGIYVNARFSHETSGLFGRELPPEKWVDFQTAMQLFLDWYSLRDRDNSLVVGWLDIHACQPHALA